MYTSTDMSVYRSFSAFLTVLTAFKEAFSKNVSGQITRLWKIVFTSNFFYGYILQFSRTAFFIFVIRYFFEF